MCPSFIPSTASLQTEELCFLHIHRESIAESKQQGKIHELQNPHTLTDRLALYSLDRPQALRYSLSPPTSWRGWDEAS